MHAHSIADVVLLGSLLDHIQDDGAEQEGTGLICALICEGSYHHCSPGGIGEYS